MQGQGLGYRVGQGEDTEHRLLTVGVKSVVQIWPVGQVRRVQLTRVVLLPDPRGIPQQLQQRLPGEHIAVPGLNHEEGAECPERQLQVHRILQVVHRPARIVRGVLVRRHRDHGDGQRHSEEEHEEDQPKGLRLQEGVDSKGDRSAGGQ